MGKVSQKILANSGKVAKRATKFSLHLLAEALKTSAKHKEDEPTFEEITYGEKSLISDKYIIHK